MAIKTISLELDAYEKLKRMKRGRESFSAVVRRAKFLPEDCTGKAILEDLERLRANGTAPAGTTFAYWERAQKEDSENARISPSKWSEE